MNSSQLELIELAMATLHKEKDSSKIKISDWWQLYKLSIQQGISERLYSIVETLPEGSKPKLMLLEQWKHRVLELFFERLLYVRCVSGILEEFARHDVPVIVLKGLAIARFYDDPEYRNMTDLDLYVQNSDFTKARNVIESMGYSLINPEDYSPLHLEYGKDNFVPIELHRTLVHSGFLGNRDLDNWYRHIWENRQTITSEGLVFLAMSNEDELINQVVHFASHTVYVGTQFKHLYDIALIIFQCNESLDWEYINTTLQTIGFIKFGRLLFGCCHALFGISIPANMVIKNNATLAQFIEDFMNIYSIPQNATSFVSWEAITCSFPMILEKKIFRPLAYIIIPLIHLKFYGITNIVNNTKENLVLFSKKAFVIDRFGLKLSK